MNSSTKGGAEQLAARFADGPHVSAPDRAEQATNGMARPALQRTGGGAR